MANRTPGLVPLTLFAALGGVAAIGLAGWSSRSGVPRPQDQETDQARWIGTVRQRELSEVSGIAISHRHPEHFWMHNDSGHPAEAWLVGLAGEARLRCPLPGITNDDWEDIASFRWRDKTIVLIADVGDNAACRATCQLYLFAEPDVEPHPGQLLEHPIAEVRRVDFMYSDGPRNCEAAGMDPASGQVILIEKLDGRADASLKAGVYSLDLSALLDGQTSGESPLEAPRIGETPIRLVTALDISTDGQRLACRNYFQHFLLDRHESQAWADALSSAKWPAQQLPVEFQGEALALAPDALSIFTASEFANQPIWQVQLSGVESPEKEPGSQVEE
jgi:hypothetical protein